MTSRPRDVPRDRVLKTLASLGYEVVRVGNHISLSRTLPDGRQATLTLPNHRLIKGATLRRACTLSGIDRNDFLRAYDRTR